ncbi:c-type cytochrome [Aurantiacibacter aquimixticola]|uniref:Cytochrome c family protein n=1 Tax=Aurantiacibacter aquimixticola TaxID=1958945 RepID=A0A419RTV4_9SPHN|nr:cytochrome c family protein [Aurantiacibacter aquimixticola]RJY09223.1 cytochrome c family protein [Aurantiacibacter aquimixticola]
MNDRLNTTFGWVLASCGIALGSSIVAGMYFHGGNAEPPEVCGYCIDAPEEGAAADSGPPLAQLLAEGSAEAGEAVFAKCTACHSIAQGGPAGIGPNLHGVMGSPIAGQDAGFAYSSALAEKGGNWTWEEMSAWLLSPRGYANGTKMSFAGLSSAEDRANVMLYMNQNGSNLALPEYVEAETEAGDEVDAPGEGPGAVDGADPSAIEAAGAMGDEQPVAENPGT